MSRSRERAPPRLPEADAKVDGSPGEPTSREFARVLHDLEVHQAELEIQNEQLRQTEFDLEASRDRYRSLYELTPVGHLTLDDQGTILEANRMACALLGQPCQSLVGSHFSGFMAEPAADRFHHHRKAVFSSEATHICELTLRRDDGEPVPVRLVSLRVSGDGKPPRAITVLIDRRELTKLEGVLENERLRSARELRESEDKLRHVAEHIEDVLYVREGPGGPFSYVSPAVERVWRIPGAELKRDEALWLNAIHPDDRGRIVRAQKLLAAGDPYDEEYRMCLPDGEVRFVRERASVVDHGSAASRVVGIASDVSEERKLEDELQRAQKMEAIGNLAGGIAHDFNNLLQAILGCAQMALDTRTPPDEARDYVGRVAEAAKRGAGLTSQLMSLSRREAANLRPISVDETVASTARLLERIVGEDIDVVAELGSGDAAVLATALQLEQVLLNLASNARDAMPQGGRLTLRSTLVEDDPRAASRLRLTVADTGIGMDAAVLAHLFEPFYTTKPRGKGTGLGLASTQAIIRRLGGSISVDSEPGRGTTFTVELPRCEEVPETPVPPIPEGRKLDGTVLVVEDEPLVRFTVAHYLSDLGLQVLEASGPEEALQLVARQPVHIDLLLSDIMMPKMSGPRLAELLRERLGELPVVFVSAYAEAELVAMGTVEPGTSVLHKPFDREALRTRLTPLLPTRVDSSRPPRLRPEGRPAVVLLVEDDGAARGALEELLPQEGYEVWSAASAEEALERLEQEGRPADLLLTDASLPGMSGLELACTLAAKEPAARTIVMSGHEHVGADDVTFLRKPVDLVELLQAIAGQLSQ